MPALRPAAPRRRGLVVLVTTAILLLGVVGAPGASAGPGARARMLDLINESRERHDLRVLKLNPALSEDAERHTRKMLRQDRIFDPPNLEEILSPYPYEHLGAAAVGCDDTLRALHRALMDSQVHRDIILHPDLRRVGIGVIRADERNLCGRDSFWVTELFYG